MNHILKINQLFKSFGRKKVLGNFNLNLEEGKVYGLLGNNGQGKTTLIRIIMGIIPADRGEIFYKGKRFDYHNFDYKREIGYIPEAPFLYSGMRVKEALDFNAQFYPAWDRIKAKAYLKRFSLPENVRIRYLSKGMKLKLELLVALAANPKLLILDDPTSGLDVQTRHDFLKDIIGELYERGTTILFSTHLVHELERIVEHLCILHNGKLILDEDYQKVKTSIRKVNLTFDGKLPQIKINGILDQKVDLNKIELVIYPWTEKKKTQINKLSPRHMDITELSLEEIFVSFLPKGEEK
ncbi:MAG: ABC transporter ATP-binding protein [Candidatus Aminicenantia bacterium]